MHRGVPVAVNSIVVDGKFSILWSQVTLLWFRGGQYVMFRGQSEKSRAYDNNAAARDFIVIIKPEKGINW